MSGIAKDSQSEEYIFLGKTIFNKYKLIRKLGQGSFGSIYKPNQNITINITQLNLKTCAMEILH